MRRLWLRGLFVMVGLALVGGGCGSLDSPPAGWETRPALMAARELCERASHRGRPGRESSAAASTTLNYFSIVPDQPAENWWWSPRAILMP